MDNQLDIDIRTALVDPEWDEFLARNRGHYQQTTYWGRFRAHDWTTVRVVLSQSGRIVAGAQILKRPFFGSWHVGYGPGGPTVEGDDVALFDTIADCVRDIARQERCVLLTVQPAISQRNLAAHLGEFGFTANPWISTNNTTLLIDLEQSPEDILARMRKSTRKNVRRGETKGIEVRQGKTEDLAPFFSVLREAGRRKGYLALSKGQLTTMWETLGPDHIKLFLGEYEGEIVSGLLVLAFADTVSARLRVWSGEHGELKPNQAVEWSVILWAKSHGYRYYDMTGVDLEAISDDQPDSDHRTGEDKWASNYKIGFGGDIVQLPAPRDYVHNPFVRFGYTTLISRLDRWPVLDRLRKAAMRRFRSERVGG